MLNDLPLPQLEEREALILPLLAQLEGSVPGFPDSERKLFNVTKAIAEFATTEPTRQFSIGTWVGMTEGHETCRHEQAKQARISKCDLCCAEAIVPNPAAWLIAQLKTRCRWWPSVAEIREFYCQYFKPLDGIEPGEEIGGRGRRAIQED